MLRAVGILALAILSSGSSMWIDATPIQDRASELDVIARSISLSSYETGIDPSILRGVLMVESGLRPDAKSKPRKDGNQDLGIAQHNSRHVAEFARLFNGGVAYDPMNPHEAILITGRILADHFYTANHGANPRAASWTFPIAFYNQGLGSVFRQGIMPQTLRHLVKVSYFSGKRM